MKSRKLIIGILMVVLLILIIPVPVGVLKDGGTRVYQALTYKIVKWNRLTDMGTYSNIRVYPFPKSMLSVDRLWELEKNTFIMCGDEAVNLMSGFTTHEVEKKAADDEFVTSQMKFSIDILKQTVSDKDNVLVSPLSVMIALAMTANGARGDTLSQMEAVIADNIGIQALNEYLSAYMRELPSDEKYSLKLANSIWFRDDEGRLSVENNFLQTNADYYGTDIYKAAFDKQTLSDINGWVETKTDGMIKDILDGISEDSVMYLINALAFEAEWMTKYTAYDVTDGIFTLADGSTQKADMMNSMEYGYLEDNMATGFIKDYQGGYKFVALLPNEGISVEEYVKALDEEMLVSLIANAREIQVEVSIPKFSYEYDIELNEGLKSLGMERAFDLEKADFSGMAVSSRGNICIGRVIHKTFIELNENGTKAGAATVVEMVDECYMFTPHDIKTVILDRPFVYMIVEGKTGLPIFMGTVMNIE